MTGMRLWSCDECGVGAAGRQRSSEQRAWVTEQKHVSGAATYDSRKYVVAKSSQLVVVHQYASMCDGEPCIRSDAEHTLECMSDERNYKYRVRRLAHGLVNDTIQRANSFRWYYHILAHKSRTYLLIDQTSGVVADRGYGWHNCSLSLNFGWSDNCSNIFFVTKKFVQKCKTSGSNPILEKSWDKFQAPCRKIANFSSTYFLTHKAAGSNNRAFSEAISVDHCREVRWCRTPC